MQNYLQLEKEIEEINQISNVVDILSWDIASNSKYDPETRNQALVKISFS
jgi:hypothetical protein